MKKLTTLSPLSTIQEFFKTGSSPGIVLLTTPCLVLAHSPAAFGDFQFCKSSSRVFRLNDRQAFLLDGLMAVFFLLIGLEIKRELILNRHLCSWLPPWAGRPYRVLFLLF